MTEWVNQRVFDLVAEESQLLYFFDRDDEKAVRPAIYITSGPVGFRREAGSDDKWTLWVGDGVKWFSFTTFEEAEAKADEISMGVNRGITVRRVKKEAKTAYDEVTAPARKETEGISYRDFGGSLPLGGAEGR